MCLKIIGLVLDSVSSLDGIFTSMEIFVAYEHRLWNDLKGLKEFSWLIGITKRINRNNGVWIDSEIKREFEKFKYVEWRVVSHHESSSADPHHFDKKRKEGRIAIFIYILYYDWEYQMKIKNGRRNFLMSGQSKIFVMRTHS